MAGLYTHITRATGTILTAAIYNADHQNHIDNHIPAMMDDYSVNLAQMQTQVDPGELGTESLATSLAGEIERFRFALKELKGTTYWYQSAVNLALISSANVFTAAQTISLSSPQNALAINTTDNGASGSAIAFNHISTTPAANDIVGNISYSGKDSAANNEVYVNEFSSILDPTSGSEDSRKSIQTLRAGVLSDVNISSGELHLGGLNAKGDVGSINCTGLYINGHGTVAQHDAMFNSTYQVLGAILPQDDTIPQNTEGDQVLSINITPTHAGSRIYIKAVLNVGGAVGLVVTASIFRAGFTNASNSSSVLINATTTMEQVVVEASYQIGIVTPQTFTVRCGSSTATDAKLNGDNTTRQFGGSSVSRVDIFEILPQ